MIRTLSLTIFAVLISAGALLGEDSPSNNCPRAVLESTGVQGGLIVHLGCGNGRLTARLLDDDRYTVQGLDTDPGNVAEAREYLRALGVYGDVSVERFDGKRLPYVDNLVNVLVAEELSEVPMGEVMRVLAPGGVACVKSKGKWEQKRKSRPTEIDEWTHWLHGADGNAVSKDTVVGPPRHVQWIAEPTWQRHHELSPSVEAMVSASGRVFAIINEALPGVDGLPDRWKLVARDAFNGKLLWKRPIAEWGWKWWSDHSHGDGRWNHPTHVSRRVVAIGDRVYATLGFNAPLTALDAATGQTIKTYAGTERTDEVLYHEGTLVLSVNLGEQGPGHIKEKPAVKKAVVALDADSGEILWRSSEFEGAASKADAIERVTHLTMVVGGDKVFLVEENAVVALDMKTGERVWRKERQADRERRVTYGNYYFTNLHSLVYHDGLVFFTEPDPTVERLPWDAAAHADLMAMSAETGDVVWSRDCGIWGHYNPGDLFVIDGRLWIHDPKEFVMLALDPQTGEVQRTVSTKEALVQGHHHRCYRNKATPNFVLTGRRGVEFINLETQENLRHHWVRGTCRYGVMPCNGLLYAPPHPCICYITAKLNGFWALAGDKAESGNGKAEDAERLEKGAAFGEQLGPADSARAVEWPTYRHDRARSGAAGTVIQGPLTVTWKSPVGGRLTSTTIADGRVFVASADTHTVWALDGVSGKPVWSYTAGGRVDTPPTIYRGLALFGSADGWVYCLRADDGKLVWRRRAAPGEQRIMNRGQLESPWPVHGSVLVQEGVAYFAAGRSSFLDGGILVYAVDPATGDVLARKRLYSPDAETGDMAECLLRYDMPPTALGALPDVMVGNGNQVFMRHVKFDPKNLQTSSALEDLAKKPGAREHQSVGAHLMSVAGLLDDSWFNQTYWSVDGKSQSKLLVFNNEVACGVKPFPGGARHSRAVFQPGTEGYTLFANERPKHKARWSVKIPVRAQAMVLAGDTLFLAGPPDVAPEDDPYAALDGKLGGKLWAVSLSDGKKTAEYELDDPPVYDGMTAAEGRLFVSTKGGEVVCLGK